MHVTKTFRDLGVDGALCDALEAQGITHPFPIQELTLPIALKGHDLIGQARTGTGKTLAFGLPLLQRVDPNRSVTQALVVVPTRELCLQVYEDLSIGRAKRLTSISVYGGVGYDEQIDALTSGVHVVVGTPGRLLDHLNRGNLDLSQVTQLVLDEADEMLDMGFLPDVERLVEACQGQDRHTMLFSATMPTEIVKLARRYMDHPTFSRADHEQKETADNVTQHFFQVHRMDKPRLLARILQAPQRGGVYVFVRTKHMADRLVNDLEELGTPAIAIHGDLRQATREKNLDRFRSGKATVLVATEVAARGLDVTGVTHVVNYDCPDDEKMYLHRIGRTARAGEAGVAVTFAEFNEVDRLSVIRKKVGATDHPVEQVFSTSELITDLFDLPAERPWDALSANASRKSDRAPRTRDGRSDGRPKSDRRSEGRGGDHDARRRERGAGRTASEGAAAKAVEATPQRDRGTARDDDAPSDERVRVRKRSRSSAAETPTSEPGDRSGATPTTAGDRGSDSGAGAGRGEERPTSGRTRARARSTTPRSDASRRSGSDRAGRPEQDRSDAPSPSGDRDGGSGRERDRKRSGSRSQAKGRDDRRDTGRNGSRSGEQRSGSSSRGDRSPDVVPVQARGADARGDGQPQLARRVKVEHLP
jgi:superfamily II DNA/RNA helicase